MENFNLAALPWAQIAVVFVSIVLAALIGYFVARQQFQQNIRHQLGLFEGEMARLRRRASTADSDAQHMRTEVERYRRKARTSRHNA